MAWYRRYQYLLGQSLECIIMIYYLKNIPKFECFDLGDVQWFPFKDMKSLHMRFFPSLTCQTQENFDGPSVGPKVHALHSVQLLGCTHGSNQILVQNGATPSKHVCFTNWASTLMPSTSSDHEKENTQKNKQICCDGHDKHTCDQPR